MDKGHYFCRTCRKPVALNLGPEGYRCSICMKPGLEWIPAQASTPKTTIKKPSAPPPQKRPATSLVSPERARERGLFERMRAAVTP